MASLQANVTLLHVNNKGLDQHAHLRSLINTVVIGLLNCISKRASGKILTF